MQQVEKLLHTTGDLSGDARPAGDLDRTGDLDLDFSRTGDTERAGDTDWPLTGDLASVSTASIFTGSASLPESAGLGDPSSSDIIFRLKADSLLRCCRDDKLSAYP